MNVEDQSEQFDDSGLKAAVRRAWGAERCPEALRHRVTAVAKQSNRSEPMVLRLRPLFGLAAAAIVLIAIGLSWWQWHATPSGSPSDANSASLAVLPASLSADLVYRHDECSRSPEHQAPGLSQDDPVELGRQMRRELNFPVLTARLGEGWHFRGAAYCPVGNLTSAHLLYWRAGPPAATVSVFSLSTDAWPGSHCTDCAELARGKHPVAGFTTPKGLYCVVGSAEPAVTLSEVRQMVEHLRPELAEDSDEAPTGRVTVAGNR